MMKGILLVTLVVMCMLLWQSDACTRGIQPEGAACDDSSDSIYNCADWPIIQCECGICTKLQSLGRYTVTNKSRDRNYKIIQLFLWKSVKTIYLSGTILNFQWIIKFQSFLRKVSKFLSVHLSQTGGKSVICIPEAYYLPATWSTFCHPIGKSHGKYWHFIG